MFRRLIAVALASAAVGLVPVLHAPPAQADTAANDQIVQSWYADFLEREDPASDPGRLYWVGQLDQGVSRRFVLGSILRDTEYATLQVTHAYRDLLGRPLDPGANYWIDQTVNHDMAWEWVEQSILGSPEYFRNAGGEDGVVRGVYAYALGRAPADGELGYWSSRARRSGALGSVRGIWNSDEGVGVRLWTNYIALLGREPDDYGFSFWRSREKQSDISTQVALASTDEYAELAAEIFG